MEHDSANRQQEALNLRQQAEGEIAKEADLNVPHAESSRQELLPSPQGNRDDILRALDILTEPGQTVELRVLGVKATSGDGKYPMRGYFRDREQLADAAMSVTKQADGVYLTINPVSPDLFDRCPDHIEKAPRGGATTDDDIVRRTWLPLDIDAERETSTSTTDCEHEGAITLVRDIVVPMMRMHGWPDPVQADSGNGAHALWRIDLPADEASRELIEAVLKAMETLFAGAFAGRNPRVQVTNKKTGATTIKPLYKVDTTVSNAARIMKLYGTIARKGEHIAERPHRTARILEVPETREAVTAEQMHAFVQQVTSAQEQHKASVPSRPQQQPSQQQRNQQHGERDDDFDGAVWFDAFVERHRDKLYDEWGLGNWEPWEHGGKKAQFDICPFDDTHKNKPACLYLTGDGRPRFKCLNASCGDYDWYALRELLGEPKREREERERSDPPDDDSGFPPESDGEMDCTPPSAASAGERSRGPERQITPSGLRDLLHQELPAVKWAVPDLIPQGLTILAGKPKVGKSWLALALTIAVGSGGRAFGQVQTERGNVLYLALEDTPRRLKERTLRILGEDWSRWDGRVDFETVWEPLDKGGYERLDRYLTEHPDTRLVVIDTFAKIRPAVRSKSGVSYDEDYKAMGLIKLLADTHQTAIVVIHHTRKGAADDPQDLVSGTTGLTGAADSTLVLTRSRQEHAASLFLTGRDIEERELALAWQTQSCSWVVTGESVEVLHLTALQRKVVAFFRSRNWEPCRKVEVLRGAGLDDNRVTGAGYKLLDRMERDGSLVRVGEGDVRIADYLRDTPTNVSITSNTPTPSNISITSSASSTSSASNPNRMGAAAPEKADAACDGTAGHTGHAGHGASERSEVSVLRQANRSISPDEHDAIRDRCAFCGGSDDTGKGYCRVCAGQHEHSIPTSAAVGDATCPVTGKPHRLIAAKGGRWQCPLCRSVWALDDLPVGCEKFAMLDSQLIYVRWTGQKWQEIAMPEEIVRPAQPTCRDVPVLTPEEVPDDEDRDAVDVELEPAPRLLDLDDNDIPF